MQNEQQIQETLDKIIGLAQTLKTSLNAIAAQKSFTPVDDIDSFESLKKALFSDKWPEAVNPHLICDPNSETDKIERGRGIIELMIEEDLKNMSFLDFGCGEGHCVFLSADYQTKISVGYDSKKYDSWNDFQTKPNLSLTNDFDQVISKGPYDIIILFDVLDHIIGDDPVSVLTKLKSVLTDNGKIYMRTHPFISRHGTHLYHELNKAYVHLVFTPDEIRQLLPVSKYEEPSLGIIYPLANYAGFISKAGLVEKHHRDITEKVEPFFKIPKIAERIMANNKITSFPEFQMSLQFIDFTLSKY